MFPTSYFPSYTATSGGGLPIGTDPEGPLTLAENYLAATLAATARLQTLLGAESSAQALERIYIDALPLPEVDGDGNVPDCYSREQMEEFRPFVLISQPPRFNYKRRRTATDTYAENGTLVVWIEIGVDDADRNDLDGLFRRMKNSVGVMLTQLDEFMYEPGYLAIDEIQVDGPWRGDENEITQLGDYLGIMLTVRWNGGMET